ncbi:hypothetical protein EIP86_007078 [Pleurotus ostreatoroseus]|nr:hypothetical protein EIP86_007078 [Pleurotus ostreatoroseus]
MNFKFATLTLFSLLPAYTYALVGVDWDVDNTPASGLTDITFPFNIANATHVSGYYFAQQFGFNGLADIGYTGLQPRPDSALGVSNIRAVFSSFVPNTTTLDPLCSLGADGGPGVSCSITIPASYAHTYNMEVVNTVGTTWTGTMVDTITGIRAHVGTWTLPAGAGGIKSNEGGFVEYYLWNDGQAHPCNTLPKTQAFFGVPTTTTAGAGPGHISTAYEYGNCIGQVAFSTSTTNAGTFVKVGVV